MTARRVLLVEPGYKNKYPPLGLMKLAAYHGPNGRGDEVEFVKGHEGGSTKGPWDRVYVTTLFSFEWRRTAQAIDFAIAAAGGQPERVFVGGISASLMWDDYSREPRWAGVRFKKGLLNGPPAHALDLSKENCDFGHDDTHGTPIEEMVPDYSILDKIAYKYPVHDAYFGYASRGCVRKCAFCGVPKLEGAMKEMPPLSQLVDGVSQAHGEKKDLVLMDNNVSASSRYREIIAEIRDLGFERGARLSRADGSNVKRRVDFNQGVDARILVKSPMYLKEMATICISPLRIAFDHIGVKKVYCNAVRMAAENDITSLSNYMLYNFMDTPADLYERMRLNILLNQELGVRIWSFPMRYQPVTLKDRSHVGRNWSRYFLRSFQIMLQATRGVVSGNPEFFGRAYGECEEEFLQLLSLPHAFIFFREHYERGAGKATRDEYEALRRKLSESQLAELIELLSVPPGGEGNQRSRLLRLASDSTVDQKLREVMRYHTLDTKSTDKLLSPSELPLFPVGESDHDGSLGTGGVLGDDEVVEDAGLYDNDSESVLLR